MGLQLLLKRLDMAVHLGVGGAHGGGVIDEVVGAGLLGDLARVGRLQLSVIRRLDHHQLQGADLPAMHVLDGLGKARRTGVAIRMGAVEHSHMGRLIDLVDLGGNLFSQFLRDELGAGPSLLIQVLAYIGGIHHHLRLLMVDQGGHDTGIEALRADR